MLEKKYMNIHWCSPSLLFPLFAHNFNNPPTYTTIHTHQHDSYGFLTCCCVYYALGTQWHAHQQKSLKEFYFLLIYV